MTRSPEPLRYREPKYTVGKAMTYALSVAVALLSLKTAMASRSDIPPAPVVHAAPQVVAVTAVPEEAPRRVSAGTLFAEYEANEVQADTKYKDHALEVAGQVQSVYQDPWDDVVVTLRTTDPFHGVRATLLNEGQGMEGLERGQAVSLACHGGDRMVGSPTLTGCSVE